MDTGWQNLVNKRILYVLGRFPTLSETFIINEIAGLLRLGLNVIPVSTGRPPKIPDEMHRAGIDLAEKTIYMPSSASMMEVLLRQAKLRPRLVFRLLHLNLYLPCLPATPKFKRFLKSVMVLEQVVKLRPDHIHGHWTIPSDVAMMVADVTSLPFSFTAHAHDIFDEDPLYEWQRPGFGLRYKISRSVFAVTCTDYNRRYLASLCPSNSSSRVYTVYHGVDTNYFRPSLKDEGRIPTILSVGRLVAYKGFDRLLTLCARLLEDGYQFQCIIVGDGSQRTALIQQANELGLDGHVVFTGPKSSDEVQQLYAQADIFVLAASLARGQHGLPNVLVEAASAGLAILTTRLPPVSELFENGQTALVVDDSEDALYMGLKQLIVNPGLRHRIGKAARKVAIERFDFERNIQVLAKLFDSHYVNRQAMGSGQSAELISCDVLSS
jgi:glycosyltransferase involved in cell wall biosynthesis